MARLEALWRAAAASGACQGRGCWAGSPPGVKARQGLSGACLQSGWGGLGLRAAAREGSLHARYRSFFLFPGPSGSAGLVLASRHWHVAKRAQTQNCTKCPGHGFPVRLGSELLSGSAPFLAPGRAHPCFFPALSVPARRLNRGGDVVCDFFAL